jgi:hypothetical protein
LQTFVPLADFHESAKCLDNRRLGKQRVEVLQILNAITSGSGRGWINHPATAMWRENIAGLSAYGVAICDEWIARGYKDTCREKIMAVVEPDSDDLPIWWGDSRVHASHRANLLRKMPEHYSEFDWDEDPEMPYFWPTKEGILQS